MEWHWLVNNRSQWVVKHASPEQTYRNAREGGSKYFHNPCLRHVAFRKRLHRNITPVRCGNLIQSGSLSGRIWFGCTQEWEDKATLYSPAFHPNNCGLCRSTAYCSRKQKTLCLFTCLEAVHLEMAWGLATNTFLHALTNSTSRHGVLKDRGQRFPFLR